MAEISPTRPITPAQVRAIHVALHRQGIDDAAYRALLDMAFGVTTCKALTRRQASALLVKLGRPLPRPPGSGPAPTARRRAARAAQAQATARASGPVVRLATPLQRVLIEELIAEAPWRAPAAVAYPVWLQHNQGIRRVATFAQAAKVIEGLKAMKRRGVTE